MTIAKTLVSVGGPWSSLRLSQRRRPSQGILHAGQLPFSINYLPLALKSILTRFEWSWKAANANAIIGFPLHLQPLFCELHHAAERRWRDAQTFILSTQGIPAIEMPATD